MKAITFSISILLFLTSITSGRAKPVTTEDENQGTQITQSFISSMCDQKERLKAECFRKFFLLHAHQSIENYFKRKFAYLERQNQEDYLVFRKL